MQFFTPQLYLQFNSADDEVADRADAKWERAVGDYQERLSAIRDRLPAEVRSLAALSLHDADVLTFDPEAELSAENLEQPMPLALVTVRHDGELLSLVYLLGDRVRESRKPVKWPFASGQRQWLYDELDMIEGPSDKFMHRILFSDGTEVEIPFLSVLVRRAALDVLVEEK